ncbi:MAG: proline racemase family protein, partial [Synergistes sp.]|nr:proline racemase family protein [Synergistes sp.]
GDVPMKRLSLFLLFTALLLLCPICSADIGEDAKVFDEWFAEANRQFSVQHPLIKQNNMILLAEFGIYKDNDNARNCVVFGAANIDRSPCGTGTCAKMALLFAQGKLKPEETFRHESIIGTVFEGHYSEKTKVGDFDAIIPFVRGEANITGFNWLIEQSRDPLLPGFLLG